MAIGTVAWFSNAKGFGFIERGHGESDVFVHHLGILMEGYRTLSQGDKVEFEIDTRKEDGRTIAVNVRVLEKANGNGSSTVHRKHEHQER